VLLRPARHREGAAQMGHVVARIVHAANLAKDFVVCHDRRSGPAMHWTGAVLGLATRSFVMAGLVPAIHVFNNGRKRRRGCPAQGGA
jgi:hypothetical protein